jgi:hypothetical protein
MESLIERYLKRLWLGSYTKEEYKLILTEMCNAAKEIGIDGHIKFSYRLFRAKKVKKKMADGKAFKAVMAELESLSEKNLDSWKAIRNKYAYFNKHVQ